MDGLVTILEQETQVSGDVMRKWKWRGFKKMNTEPSRSVVRRAEVTRGLLVDEVS